jgi:4-amino-4-deoxy-L-arabinose transferase-like glycosyltransferase
MNRSGVIFTAWWLLLLVSMLAWLGSYPLMQPDEGRNAEVAREMVASGDFVVPHLNGLPYVDKPALYFAAAGVSLKALGANEFAARLPSILFTLLTAAMVAWFGRRVWNAEVGVTAAAMTLSAPLVFGMSRVVILDSLLAMLMVGSLMSLYLAIEARAAATATDGTRATGAPWRRWSLLAWAFIGLGILTKGPVAILIPLIAGIPYAVRRRAVGAVFYLPAIALAILVVAPWVVQMSRELPGYLNYVVVTETWARVTSDKLHRSQPFWFFVPVLAAGAFPWICMAIAGLWQRRRARPPAEKDPRILFLLLWVVLPFLFFSLSRSKLPHYMLPLVPAVALLAAVFTTGERESKPPGRTASFLLLCLVGIAALATGQFMRPGSRVDPATIAAARTFLLLFGATAGVTGALGLLLKPRGRALVALLSLPMIVAGLASGPLLAAVGADRSAKRLASAIQASAQGRPRVVGVVAFPTSLPFYLRAPIETSSSAGGELTSNYVRAKYPELLAEQGSTLHDADWWVTLLEQCRDPVYFVVRGTDDAAAGRLRAAGVPLLVQDRRYSVYGPCRSPGRPAA